MTKMPHFLILKTGGKIKLECNVFYISAIIINLKGTSTIIISMFYQKELYEP